MFFLKALRRNPTHLKNHPKALNFVVFTTSTQINLMLSPYMFFPSLWVIVVKVIEKAQPEVLISLSSFDAHLPHEPTIFLCQAERFAILFITKPEALNKLTQFIPYSG
jgi:hypothetical protein